MTTTRRWVSLVVIGLAVGSLALGCGSDDSTSGGSGGAGTGGTGTGGATANFVGVAGVTVTQVAIYQGPERILATAGAAQPSTVPLVAGRGAMVRIFYTATPDQVGAAVVGRITLDDGTLQEAPGTLVAESTALDLASTINVPLTALPATLNYRASIIAAGESDNPTAHHPADGFEAHVVDGPQNTLRVVVVPYQYNADGSGRLPDTSPEALQGYRDRIYQLYPVSNVEVTAAEPVPWDGVIDGTGAGWQQVGIDLFTRRGTLGIAPDVYLYGMFNPADSFPQFCGAGCLLGVTLLNNMPPDLGDPALRLALGVGFPEYASGTMAHEIGHAHGRGHAPCGPGLDPNSIDLAYPYGDGSIGTTFFDLVANTLVDGASSFDIMSYCDPQMISDYNYRELLTRSAGVNLPKTHAGPSADLIAFDDSGQATRRLTTTMPAGTTMPVTIVDGPTARDVDGLVYRFDHLPGGWLFLPEQDEPARTIDITIDGAPRRLVID